MKIYEWLGESSDGHSIHDHEKLAKDFKEKTGHDACWPAHTVAATNKAIDVRGLGGYCKGNRNDLTAWGYQVAIALAREYVPGFESSKIGRGSAFYEALEALQKENV